jgi:hypothetical protein
MLTVGTFQSLLGIAQLCGAEGVELDVLVTGGESAITRGRSNLAATFLRTERKTFAMLDADISIEPEDFLRLLRLEKPIRGAAVALKTPTHEESLSCWKDGRQVKRAEMPAEPFEVDYLGGAVMLIEREVIEALSADLSLRYVDPIAGEGSHIFAEVIVDQALLSEDYAFCHRARQAGFSIWVDGSVIVGHKGPCEWRA